MTNFRVIEGGGDTTAEIKSEPSPRLVLDAMEGFMKRGVSHTAAKETARRRGAEARPSTCGASPNWARGPAFYRQRFVPVNRRLYSDLAGVNHGIPSPLLDRMHTNAEAVNPLS